MTASDSLVVVDGWDSADEGRREAILDLGNGRLATRGAAPESCADGTPPGTYAAGWGLLVRTLRFVDGSGRRTVARQRRFVHRSRTRLAGLPTS